MSEELITFEARIFNEKDYYIDDIKVTKELFYKIKNKCIEENKIIKENQQLKEEICEWKINYTKLQNKVIECNEDRIRLNNVLDEIREKIDFYIHYSTSDSTYMSYQQYKEILQIIDKVI